MEINNYIYELIDCEYDDISKSIKNNPELFILYLNKFIKINSNVLSKVSYLYGFDKNDYPLLKKVSRYGIADWFHSKLGGILRGMDYDTYISGGDFITMCAWESEFDISPIKELAEKISANILKSQN